MGNLGQEELDEDKYEQDDFEESPRPKGPSNGVARSNENEDRMENDEERIEIAEKVLITIVKTMNQHGIAQIRDLVKDMIYESMIDGNELELIMPDAFLQALASIGVELD